MFSGPLPLFESCNGAIQTDWHSKGRGSQTERAERGSHAGLEFITSSQTSPRRARACTTGRTAVASAACLRYLVHVAMARHRECSAHWFEPRPVQNAPCPLLIHHAVWPLVHDADALSGPSHPFVQHITFSLCFLSHRNLRPAPHDVD